MSEQHEIDCPYHGRSVNTWNSCPGCGDALGVAGDLWRKTYAAAVGGLIVAYSAGEVFRMAREAADVAFYTALREVLDSKRHELPMTLLDRVCFPKPLDSPPQV